MMEQKKPLHLSSRDKKIAGVLGGIGETYGIDPTLLRVLVVLLTLATGLFPFVVAYLIAWAVMPKDPNADVRVEDL